MKRTRIPTFISHAHKSGDKDALNNHKRLPVPRLSQGLTFPRGSAATSPDSHSVQRRILLVKKNQSAFTQILLACTTGGWVRNHSPGHRDGMSSESTITDKSFGDSMPISHVSEGGLVIQTRTFKGDYHLNEDDEYKKS